MTEKLYYSDSHLHSFTATVLSCTEKNSLYEIVLDRTAFFPEGGGQRPDTGKIGEVSITDVQEKDGVIVHFGTAPVAEGALLECSLDWEQRIRRMQNHSGEHIVSGITHKLFGWDNVGFHMGEAFMTIDFSGELTWDELCHIETLANEKIRENVPIKAWFPEHEELESLQYRSKLELTHDVRLVEIESCDICACCAPHVSRTGEVGIIKILDCMRHRGGVRVSLVCGADALDNFRLQQRSVTEISRMLSAKREDVSAAVERLMRDKEAQKDRISTLSMENVLLMTDSMKETDGNVCVFNNSLDEISLRELANKLTERCGGLAAVLSGDDSSGYKYIIGSRRINLRNFAREINNGIVGKGGGSPTMIQGSCSANRDTIRDFLSDYNPQN